MYLVQGWWCLLGGVYLVSGGECTWFGGGGGSLLWGGVPGPGGVPGRGGVPGQVLTPPPVDRHTPVKTQPSQLRCGR